MLASTLTDLHYICQRPVLLGPAGAKIAIEMVMQRFEVLRIDRAAIQSALLLPGLEFEDNVQIACAVPAAVWPPSACPPLPRHQPAPALSPLAGQRPRCALCSA